MNQANIQNNNQHDRLPDAVDAVFGEIRTGVAKVNDLILAWNIRGIDLEYPSGISGRSIFRMFALRDMERTITASSMPGNCISRIKNISPEHLPVVSALPRFCARYITFIVSN